MYAELTRIRKCKICNKLKKPSEFHKNGAPRKDGSSGPRTECKECSTEIHRKYVAKCRYKINARRKDNYRKNRRGLKVRISEAGVRYRYKLTSDRYQEMMAEQNNACAICLKSYEEVKRRLDVDHDHRTGKIRGLLCVSCNRGLGLLKDDIKVLDNAIKYLEKSKK